MEKVTQEQFAKLPIIGGIKQCTTADYPLIKQFSESCSFSESCRFGESSSFSGSCSFGEWCSFGQSCSFEDGHEIMNPLQKPFISFSGLGSRKNSKTYVWDFKDGIFVRCGCWFGTVEAFKKRVEAIEADAFYMKFVELAVSKIKSLW